MQGTDVATPETEAADPAPPTAPRRSRLRLWGMKLGLLAGSTLAFLLLLEVVFRLAGYQPIYSVYSKPELFWRHDARLGWTLQPGAHGTYVGPRPFPVEFRGQVRINSLGFRGPEVTPVAPGGRRVLLLGDSQAAGFEVNEDQTYAALTAGKLTATLGVPVQVENGGIRGYGTDQSLLWYEEHLRSLHPDLVVFHATGNDPEDDTTLHRMRRPFGKAAFALDADGTVRPIGLPIRNYPLCSAYRVDASFRVVRIDGRKARAFCWMQTRLADHSAFLTFLSTRIERNPALVKRLYGLGTPDEQARPITPASPTPAPPAAGPPAAGSPPPPLPATPAASSPATPATPATPVVNPALDYAHRLTTTLILKMAGDVRRDGARFVLLIDSADLAPLDGAALRAAGIEILPADAPLGADQTLYRFPNDGHLNAAGHRRMAEFLAPRLAADLQPAPAAPGTAGNR
ncbi:MAG TPA: SGNH/GDSL hydrolase family protein [Acidimicrobiia bacterium]|nr:SGNH/GDSL hydrolase family protein [Acidimicrobiia bacterium]